MANTNKGGNRQEGQGRNQGGQRQEGMGRNQGDNQRQQGQRPTQAHPQTSWLHATACCDDDSPTRSCSTRACRVSTGRCGPWAGTQAYPAAKTCTA